MIDWLLRQSAFLCSRFQYEKLSSTDRSLSLVSRCSPPLLFTPFTPLSLIHRSPQHHQEPNPKPANDQYHRHLPPPFHLQCKEANTPTSMRSCSVTFLSFQGQYSFFEKERREQKMHVYCLALTATAASAVIPKEQRRLVVWPKSDTFIWSIVTCHCHALMPNMCNCCSNRNKRRRRFWIS